MHDLCREVRESPLMRVCVLDEGKVEDFIKGLSEVERKVTEAIPDGAVDAVITELLDVAGVGLEGGAIVGNAGMLSRSVVAVVDLAYDVLKEYFGCDGIKACVALVPLIYASFYTALGVEGMVLEEPNEFGLFMLMYRAFRSDDMERVKSRFRKRIWGVVNGLGIGEDLKAFAFVKVALSMLTLAVVMITELAKKDVVEVLKGLLLYVKGRAFFEEEMIVVIPRKHLLGR